ncbi:proline iminopeptidase [Limosilactobacillus secaliphilus]|uniref:Proline iminopeptidase n=1 Tax=Limosilactobacillus secaliphilus TaxID=396268 RepID=A0A0R2I244_9LACO|nr:proline iminopeptidase-family hydrolase [Limosilactobacillus secaliphilus]KRN58955.1 prolyl aminopeptidase [Limosilactobacillus secaliphilus]
MTEIQEGYMPFGQYQTYYRIVGRSSEKTPLVLLHGGPGSTHNYFELFDSLAEVDHRQLIMYDQIGCGKSSMPDDPQLYNRETWVEELMALRKYLHLDRIHLLGQSWGGMLAIIYMCDQMPAGVKSLILASTLSDSQLWGQEQHRMIKFLPQKEQDAIQQAEQSGNYQSAAYQAANAHYMHLHCADEPSRDSPECLKREKNAGEVAYNAAWGPNEYTPIGNLKDYDYTAKLAHLYTPTLITSGTNDLCTPLVAKTMADALPNASWHLFAGTRHMSFVEKPMEYKNLLMNWLNSHD